MFIIYLNVLYKLNEYCISVLCDVVTSKISCSQLRVQHYLGECWGEVLCWVYQKWPDECPSIVSSVYTHRVVMACTNFKQIVQILHADNYPHNSDCWKYN